MARKIKNNVFAFEEIYIAQNEVYENSIPIAHFFSKLARLEVQKDRDKNPEKYNLICKCCGALKYIFQHHEDYSKPLEVISLCGKCHSQIHHKKTREIIICKLRLKQINLNVFNSKIIIK